MEDNRGNQDKRKSERLNSAFTLTYTVEKPVNLRFEVGWDNDLDALMVDISDLGMSIITKHNLSIGAQLHFKINIIDHHLEGDERWKHMEVNGTVVHSVRLSDKSHKIGIRFDQISAKDKLLISDFVKRNKISS